MLQDYDTYDATGLALLVESGDASPEEIVEAAIAKIEEVNPVVNAVIIEAFDRGRATAKEGPARGPFRGVPFLLKDIHAQWAGVEYTQACRFLKGFVPQEDSPLTSRYKAAGLVLLGRTNCSEMGLLSTEPLLYGPTRNPWDLTRVVGGSSGGSAAAVAARMVPAAHANDGFGSIRIPAACCGVFGLKPTRARVPESTDFGGLGVDHVVSRSVRDSAALLDAVRGSPAESPYYATDPVRPFVQEVGEDPGRLHIAFSTKDPMGREYSAAVSEAVISTAKLLEEAGHHVEESDIPFGSTVLEQGQKLMIAGAPAIRRQIDEWAARLGKTPTADDFEPYTWFLYSAGDSVKAVDLLIAQQALRALAETAISFFHQYDVFLNAVLAETPPAISEISFSPESPTGGWERINEWARPFNASLANMTGQPAMSVPLAWSDDNLPIGIQFTGRYGDEATLLRLGSQLEEARPWADRMAPLR
ncbi:MAG TPA: amidase family protein [Actinomycetota bacterium]